MKTKIFKMRGNSFSFRKKAKTEEILEKQINDWLAANPAIKIRDIKQIPIPPVMLAAMLWRRPLLRVIKR